MPSTTKTTISQTHHGVFSSSVEVVDAVVVDAVEVVDAVVVDAVVVEESPGK
jgi:hypothetical protein